MISFLTLRCKSWKLVKLSDDAGLSLSSFVTGEHSVSTPGVNQYDYTDDQQTGNAQSSADIVGNNTNPALYMQFDNGGTAGNHTDGTIFFRARLGAPGGSGTPEFDRNLFIGIDADGNGDLDMYLGVHNQGSSDELAVYNPGAGLNISPNTTTIGSPPTVTFTETAGTNYRYTTVDTVTTDIDGDGNTDYFLSFAMPFNTLVSLMATAPFGSIAITDQTSFRYVMATATQDNSFNQDLNGVPKAYDINASWSTLGALSSPMSPTSPVPEPAGLAVMGLALVGLAGWRLQTTQVDSKPN